MNSSNSAESLGILHTLPVQLNNAWPGLGVVLFTFVLVATTVIVFDKVVLPRFTTVGKFWARQQWIAKDEWFRYSRAQLRFLKHGVNMIAEGYEKYSKQGKAFALPMLTHQPYLVLPPSHIRTLLNKPDTEIDAEIPHSEATQQDWTTEDMSVVHELFQFDVVKKELTRKLSVLTEEVHDELDYAMRQRWSNSTDEWNTVNVYASCMSIVAQAANRVFAGPELCRDADFIEHSKLYSQGVFGGSALIRMFPNWMKPIVGRVVAYPNNRNRMICFKHAEPVIKERLANTRKKIEDPDFEWKPPADALQWLIERVVARNIPSELKPLQISDRLLRLNMVAIHTTSMVTSNVIMDIFSAPNSKEILHTLREECSQALAAHGGRWTKAAVNSLIHADSTIRESMRWSNLGALGLNRMVVADNGVDFGDIHVPRGIRVAIPASAIHNDPEFYPDPGVYDPFRFSRVHTTPGLKEQDARAELQRKNCALITVADDFLGFGHGRHSCPGRFFAAQEMKLMLAEIVLGFDIELLSEGRPQNKLVAAVSMPNPEAEMRVRRRKA